MDKTNTRAYEVWSYGEKNEPMRNIIKLILLPQTQNIWFDRCCIFWSLLIGKSYSTEGPKIVPFSDIFFFPFFLKDGFTANFVWLKAAISNLVLKISIANMKFWLMSIFVVLFRSVLSGTKFLRSHGWHGTEWPLICANILDILSLFREGKWESVAKWAHHPLYSCCQDWICVWRGSETAHSQPCCANVFADLSLSSEISPNRELAEMRDRFPNCARFTLARSWAWTGNRWKLKVDWSTLIPRDFLRPRKRPVRQNSVRFFHYDFTDRCRGAARSRYTRCRSVLNHGERQVCNNNENIPSNLS